MLIVPYGIETRKRQGCGTHASVLIVPYGIETSQRLQVGCISQCVNCTLWNWNQGEYQFLFYTGNVLIVPYGIETWLHHAAVPLYPVLIVPYGIET